MNKGNKRNSIIAVTKLKSIIKRINVLNVLGIKNIGEKLSQEHIDLKSPEDSVFIAQLLQKDQRTQQEVDFLKKAFEKMKFFEKQQELLTSDIYNMLFHKIHYIQKKKQDVLFHYGQKDHTYYIVLTGQASLLIPKQELINQLKSEHFQQKYIKEQVLQNIQNFLVNNKKTYNKTSNLQRIKQYLNNPEIENDSAQQDINNYIQQVYSDYNQTKVMYPGDAFGEIAIINRSQRTGTVLCRTDCEFMTLDAKSFDLILKHQERRLLKLKYQFLNLIPETYNITEVRKNDMIHSIQLKKYKMFDYIFKQGEDANAIYQVNDGEVELSKSHKTTPQNTITVRISLLTNKSIFGKDDIIKNENRTVNAICHSRFCEVFILPRYVFEKALKNQLPQPEGINWRNEQINKSQILSQHITEKFSPYKNLREEVCAGVLKKVKHKETINMKLWSQIEHPKTDNVFCFDSQVDMPFHQKIQQIKSGLSFCNYTVAQNKNLFLKSLSKQYSFNKVQRSVSQTQRKTEKKIEIKRVKTNQSCSESKTIPKTHRLNLDFQQHPTEKEKTRKKIIYPLIFRKINNMRSSQIISAQRIQANRQQSSVLIKSYL